MALLFGSLGVVGFETGSVGESESDDLVLLNRFRNIAMDLERLLG